MISLFFVGLAVLQGIEYSGMKTVEQQLIGQSRLAQVYISQTVFSENNNTDKLNSQTVDKIVSNLSQSIGQVRIYDKSLKLLGASAEAVVKPIPSNDVSLVNALTESLNNNYSYIVRNNIVYFTSPIEIQNKIIGVLEIIYPLSMLNTILSDVTGILLVGALIFCIMLTFLSIYISKRVVKPIKKLVDAANRYANRDFTPIEIKSRDEIGDLGKKFNEMGYQLKDYISRQKQFVANVSHELRTPLTAIKGYSEYLLEEVKGRTDLEKSIYHLNNESVRLAKLVDELLLLSRIDSVKEDFPFEKLNFSLLIKETTEKMLNRAAKYGLIITTDIQQNVFISGDRSKLTQVIVNLLDNAIKFSLPEGHIEVNLSARGNDAVLEITDHGIGIPKDEAPKVLDRFYRASNAAAVSGSGLGLSITKEIVDKHNGSIEIISSVDAGTTAKLSLPELKCN